MGFNQDIAARFDTMAKLLELLGESRFKVNAHAKAARVIGEHASDLEPIAADASALKELDGIGDGTAKKIAEFAASGTIKELDGLLEKVPAGLLEVLDVQGLGPKTVKLMWDELGITDIDGLKAALDSGDILKLPRMGEKAAAKIKESIAFMATSGGRLQLGLALPAAEAVLERVRAMPGVRKADIAGSLRRGKETIGDVDILCVADDPAAVREEFTTHESVQRVLAAGERKCSVLIGINAGSGRWKRVLGDEGSTLQVDLRMVPEASWGAALMYFTGSKAHNVRLRERALERGMTLNEYGLFPEDKSTDEPPQKRGIEPVASGEETAVFNALDLVYVEPELREDRGEVALSDDDALPALVTVDDIRSELHAHTTESDGKLSLDELVQNAIDRGFHTIAVTDHSKSSAQARGLDEQRLRKQREDIERARDTFAGKIQILHGSEVDILADGSLDFDDDILSWLDIVVASPHAALTQKPAEATKRLLAAIEHPRVDILGHPTGRIIGKRPGLEPAMDELLAAAVEHGTALEINAHWLRLDLRDTHVKAAVEAGAMIAIDCDVHEARDFDNLRYGVMTGRRGWLTTERCLNCMTAEGLSERVGRSRNGS